MNTSPITKQPASINTLDNEDLSTENCKNKILDGNKVDVDILPKVGGNSIVINLCSCFPISYSDSAKRESKNSP